MNGKLQIVPTPIGNMEDITLRAIRILNEVDIIACEDTRHSGQLMKKLNIKRKKYLSYHEHNEKERALEIIKEIQKGKNIAILADAGTPGISDPGYRVIQVAIESDISISVLPGPTAFVPALIGSGLPSDKFVFLGFPPQKKGRLSFLKKALGYDCTIILYESPHRIAKLIESIYNLIGGDRRICIAREISKIYEEYNRGTIEEIYNKFSEQSNPVLKGEMVVVIEGKRF